MNVMRQHGYFKEADKYKYEFWNIPLVIGLVVLFYTLGQIPFTIYARWKTKMVYGDDWKVHFEKIGDPSQWAELGMNPLFALALFLLTFLGATVGLYIAIRAINARPFRSLITTAKKINIPKIIFGFIVWLIITSSAEGLGYILNPGDYVWNFEWRSFVILLVICLCILPIQTSFEELFVRGYLMQYFGVWLKVPLLAIIFSSLFFASLHMMNPEIAQYGRGIMLAYYICAGSFLAIMTVMDDSLELALGVHFATNFSSALFVTYEGAALQTPALFKMINTDMDYMITGFLIMAFIFLFICYKRYNWPSPHYLLKRIELNEDSNV